jgi:autotransporter strand-loop-strand O-heptosyltransferase
VEYFDSPKVSYLPHGVDINFFKKEEIDETQNIPMSLLCVANNGYAGDPTIDRKGFRFAIEAAKRLDLPITIAGPSNNRKFFEANINLLEYNKLYIEYDLTEDELLKLYNEHTIFLHPSELEAGHPNLTILEAMACGLPVIGTIEDHGINLPAGMHVIDLKNAVNEIVEHIIYIRSHYESCQNRAFTNAHAMSWERHTKKLLLHYDTLILYRLNREKMGMLEKLIEAYTNTEKLFLKPKKIENQFNINFVDGAFVEILGALDSKYRVKFIDNETGNVLFQSEISNNMWTKCTIKYFVNWQILIDEEATGNSFVYNYEAKDRRVYIALDSKSLGDTLAWFPYVDEFRKKWNCKVICSTFHNNMFNQAYPELEFVNPGTPVHNIHAMYTVGWFYKADGEIDFERNPKEFKNQPLQKTSCDILGLSYREIRPKYNIDLDFDFSRSKKQVCIAIHSTAQAKYWNNPFGWHIVVKYLQDKGYKVRLLSKEGEEYMGNKVPKGVILHPVGNIEKVIHELRDSQLFIGIGSGLSWLSWMTKTPTIIISGFSDPYTETKLDTYNVITPEGLCTGCFNRHRLDPGDWNWCPEHKGTSRQFECTKSITPEMVIEQINKIIPI